MNRYASITVAALLVFNATYIASAGALCGDADGNGVVTVTDGVQVLRAAAGLSSDCTSNPSVCDVDANGAITVTDGVDVLRAAAELPNACNPIGSPTVTPTPAAGSITQDVGGVKGGTDAADPFGIEPTARLEAGIGVPPPTGGPPPIVAATGDSALPSVTRPFEVSVQVSGSTASAAAAGSPSLIIAARRADNTDLSDLFQLPLAASSRALVGVQFASTLGAQSFTLRFAACSDNSDRCATGTLSQYAPVIASPVAPRPRLAFITAEPQPGNPPNPAGLLLTDTDVYVAEGNADILAVFTRMIDGTLSSLQTILNDDTNGLGAVDELALSPDGNNLYVTKTADPPAVGALAVFQRTQDGKLTFVETHVEGINGDDGLFTPVGVVVSADGHNVYVTGFNDGAVAAFARDTGGHLTFMPPKVLLNGGGNPLRLGISDDDKNLYVPCYGNSMLIVVDRDPASGQLTVAQTLQNGAGNVDGMSQPIRAVVSHDGRHVYVNGLASSAIAVFARDQTTGALTFSEKIQDVFGAFDLAISPDDSRVYAAVLGGVAVFDRDAVTGTLTVAEVELEGVNGVGGVSGVRDLAADTRNLYASSVFGGDLGVAIFGVSP